MHQYEERLKQINRGSFRCQEDLTQLRLKMKKENQNRESSLNDLLVKSSHILSQIQKLESLEKCGDDSIHDLQIEINKVLGLNDSGDQVIIQTNNHLVDIYQTIGVEMFSKQDKLHSQMEDYQWGFRKLMDQLQRVKDENEEYLALLAQ